MGQSTQDQKTNIDDLFFPSWIIWVCFWPGLLLWILLLMTAFGFRPPVDDVYFSPTLWGRFVHQIIPGGNSGDTTP